MFLLSSLDRLRRYIDIDDDTANNRLLTTFLLSTTKNLEKFLNRKFLKESRTEYYDVESDSQLTFFPIALPIASITSAYADSTGLYDGSVEGALTDYYIGKDSNSVVLDYPILQAQKGLRIIYTGGLSEHGTRSTLALTSISGTFTTEKFVTGSLSGAVGKIVTTTAVTPLIVETLMGEWEVGDILSLQNTEGGEDVAGIAGTISALTIQAACETYPELAMAAEMQIRYMWKHKDDFENKGVTKDGTNYRQLDRNPINIYQLCPEVRTMCQGYKRYAM